MDKYKSVLKSFSLPATSPSLKRKFDDDKENHLKKSSKAQIADELNDDFPEMSFDHLESGASSSVDFYKNAQNSSTKSVSKITFTPVSKQCAPNTLELNSVEALINNQKNIFKILENLQIENKLIKEQNKEILQSLNELNKTTRKKSKDTAELVRLEYLILFLKIIFKSYF
jgi:hypothetical protein